MSTYSDIDWVKRRNKEDCIANALRVTEYAGEEQDKETCCVNTSRNSQNFLNNRN